MKVKEKQRNVHLPASGFIVRAVSALLDVSVDRSIKVKYPDSGCAAVLAHLTCSSN